MGGIAPESRREVLVADFANIRRDAAGLRAAPLPRRLKLSWRVIHREQPAATSDHATRVGAPRESRARR